MLSGRLMLPPLAIVAPVCDPPSLAGKARPANGIWDVRDNSTFCFMFRLSASASATSMIHEKQQKGMIFIGA